MKEHINKYNRTMVELLGVILLWGGLVQITGVWFVKEPGAYSLGLWLGVGIGLLAGFHMWYSLDRAFSGSEGDVTKKMITANLLRYFVIFVLFAILAFTGVGNPVMVFVGIMGLKAAAYLQPFAHKLTVRFWKE